MEPYHQSTQEWSYYKFDSIAEGVKFLHKQIKTDKFDPLSIADFSFDDCDNGDGVLVGVMDSYENH